VPDGNLVAEVLTIVQNSLMLSSAMQNEALFNVAYRNNNGTS